MITLIVLSLRLIFFCSHLRAMKPDVLKIYSSNGHGFFGGLVCRWLECIKMQIKLKYSIQ